MAVFTQHLVLSQQQSLDSTHQRTAFTGQVGSCFTDESSFKQITGTDADTQRKRSVQSLARSILIDSVRRVQATAFEEHCTQ